MRAVLRDRYGPPDVLGMASIDRPGPTGDAVLVRVEAASLNTADLDHLRGFRILGRMVEAGEVRPVIDRRYPPEEVPEAFRRLSLGAARGKLVVLPHRTDRTPEQ